MDDQIGSSDNANRLSANGRNGSSNGKSRATSSKLHLMELIGNAIVGGMESYVLSLIQHLSHDEFEITCLCPYESRFTDALRALGCHVAITPIQDDPPWRSIQTGVALVRQRGIDVIHAHLPNAHILGGIIGGMARTPVVATLHGMNLSMLDLGICQTGNTHLIVVCQEAYHQALAVGIPANRLSLIPNGVDLERFHPARNGDALRHALGVPLDARLVGFVGRLSWEKGPDKFVRAAEHVLRERLDTHFALVGEGPLQDSLKEQTKRAGLSDRIHFAGVSTQTEDVYPAFDLVAVTSRHEGMPLALLEAMASGKPVVALGVGGVAEQIQVGSTGLLIGTGDWTYISSGFPSDWEGVASAILHLLARPDVMTRMGQAARARAEHYFDLGQSVAQITNLFHCLTNSRRRESKQNHLSTPSIDSLLSM